MVVLKANGKMQEATSRRDEFLAMLGHELRNPLAPIANGIVLLRRLNCDNPDVARICDMVDRQLGSMRRLLDDLLDVARLHQGKLRVECQPLDLQPVVQSAIEVCRPFLERRSHQLTVELPPQPLRVLGDATRLSQAIANLLNNAIKYTPHDGSIIIRASLQQAQVTLCVRDNGIGMTPTLLPRIFELFVQGEQEAGKPHTGLGVGLALVDSIVQAHGGTVRALSEGRDLGSEFVMTLPYLEECG